ncbi:MAG: hypothetical protein AAB092_07320 [Chloroflexota bacterium]
MNRQEHDAEVLALTEEVPALIAEIRILIEMLRSEGLHTKADRWLGAIALLEEELEKTLNPFAPTFSDN